MQFLPASVAPQVGESAPEIDLLAHEADERGVRWRLSDRRGRGAAVVVFHPLSLNPISNRTLRDFDAKSDDFAALDAEVVMISTEHGATLNVWATAVKPKSVRLLSDFLPRGSAARAYGTLRATEICERAVVAIDRDGVIRSFERGPLHLPATPDAALTALRAAAADRPR